MTNREIQHLRLAQLHGLFGRNRLNLLVLTLVGWTFSPILRSALQGDDIPNSMRSASLSFTSETRWAFIGRSIREWLTNQGRFFPVSAIENVFLFSTVHSVALYKVIQLIFVVLVLVCVGILISRVMGQGTMFPLAVVITAACVQTRNWYDPTFGFGLLLQSVSIKVLGSAFLLFKACSGSRRARWILASVSIWILALLQYEVVITLLPTIVIVAIVASDQPYLRRVLFCLPHIVVSVLVVCASQIMRTGKIPAPAYSIDTAPKQFFLTYAKQLSGSLPLGPNIFGIGSPFGEDQILTWTLVAFLALGVLTVAVTRRLGRKGGVNKRLSLAIFLIGLNFVLGPGIPTSLSVRWQQELGWGYAYLPVFLQYLGVGMVLTACLGLLASMRGARYLTSAALAIVLLAGFNHANLLQENVNLQQAGRVARDLYELAVREGLYHGVPDESVVRTPFADPNGWVNSYFTEWLGGPKGLAFVRDQNEELTLCGAGTCTARRIYSLQARELTAHSQMLLLFDQELTETGPAPPSLRASTPPKIFRVAATRRTDPICPGYRETYVGKKFRLYNCPTTEAFIQSVLLESEP
jgi:hypothetical protein